jgi:hypothetical protein
MYRLCVLMVLLCLALVSPANAQETDDPSCSTDDINAALTPILDQLTAAQAEADPTAAQALIVEAQQQLALINAQCTGLNLEGDAGDVVVGPLSIPMGIYKVTATTPGFLIINGTVVSGVCENDYSDSVSLFAILTDTATNGSETLLKIEGEDCLVIWEISHADAAYTVTFEKLD